MPAPKDPIKREIWRQRLSDVGRGIPHPKATMAATMARKDPIKESNRIEKIRIAHSGERAYQWAGDSVGIQGVHIWARKNVFKPDICQMCQKPPIKKLEIHNIHKTYRRINSPHEWVWLCTKCHRVIDGRVDGNLKKGVLPPRGVDI